MKALLIQLSDIHIISDEDNVLNRKEKIVEAVRNLDTNLDLCVLTVTGDIGFSGKDAQYMLAMDFLTGISAMLKQELAGDVRIETVVIPGNHDCDFGASGQAREIILKTINSNPQSDVDKSVVALCTETQNNFFFLQELIANNGLQKTDRLYWEYEFEVNKEKILFRCCNTAWVSSLRESAGQLYFPINRISNNQEAANIAVTIFHHPYNWLEPNNARAFRNRIEEVSDIILTGHEHSSTIRTQQGSRGEVNLYIEAGALQENNNPKISEFNAIIIDSKSKRQKLTPFAWDGAMYNPTVLTTDWEEYHVNRLRTAGELDIREEMRAILDDLGLSVNHPSGRPLTRKDIFIYPDLRETISFSKESPKTMKGENLIEFISEAGRILITGGDESGKTTLAKQLFEDYRAKGFVPILVNGNDIKRYSDEKAANNFAKIFAEQYKGLSSEAYKQLDRNRRVLIIDDIHKSQTGKAVLHNAIEQMKAFAGQIILFAHEVFLQFGELAGNSKIMEGDESFAQYKIQPLGHLRRNEITEKWFSLDEDLRIDQPALARRTIEAKGVMDTAIGKNFVPSYPVMVISILQAIQHSQQVDVSASTYGYFYELLIRRSLAEGSNHELFDVKLGYLSFLANELFELKASEIDEQQLREIHKSFEAKKLLPVNFSLLIGNLLKSNIIEENQNLYSFKYPYIYYYFLASYLKDNISSKKTRETIASLAQQVHTEESANVLLFLAHLTKDSYIVEQMLIAAREVFKEFPRAELTISAFPTKEAEAIEIAQEYVEVDTNDSRKKHLEELDEVDETVTIEESKREKLDEEFAEGQEYVTRVSSAFRTLQILGQLLKNFVGSMDGDDKMQITDECIGIGLRALSSMYSEVQKNGQEFINDLKEILRKEKENDNLTNLELHAKAIESLFGLVFLSSYSVVKIVAHSIGSPRLAKVYNLLLAGKSSAILGTINASLALEHTGKFPEEEVAKLNKELHGNILAQNVLRSLVLNHFHLFEVRFDVKQRVCQNLGITYRPSVGANPHRRLLSSGK